MTTRAHACQSRPVLLPGFSSALASFGLIKKQPQAFWCITPARLTVAVLSQAADVGEEPLLVACAGLEAARAWGQRPAFAPGLPILKSLPLLGPLFGSRARDGEGEELVVIITPHLVADEGGD